MIEVSCPSQGLYFDIRSEKNDFQINSKIINYRLKPRPFWGKALLSLFDGITQSEEYKMAAKRQGTYINPLRAVKKSNRAKYKSIIRTINEI